MGAREVPNQKQDKELMGNLVANQDRTKDQMLNQMLAVRVAMALDRVVLNLEQAKKQEEIMFCLVADQDQTKDKMLEVRLVQALALDRDNWVAVRLAHVLKLELVEVMFLQVPAQELTKALAALGLTDQTEEIKDHKILPGEAV